MVIFFLLKFTVSEEREKIDISNLDYFKKTRQIWEIEKVYTFIIRDILGYLKIFNNNT